MMKEKGFLYIGAGISDILVGNEEDFQLCLGFSSECKESFVGRNYAERQQLAHCQASSNYDIGSYGLRCWFCGRQALMESYGYGSQPKGFNLEESAERLVPHL